MPHNPNTMTMSKTTKTPPTATIISTWTLTRWTIFTTASLLIFYVTFNRRCRCGMIGLFSCLKLDGWLVFLWVFWAVVDVYCAVAVDCVDEILVWWITKFCGVLLGLGVVYVGYVWRNGFYLDGLDPFNSLVYVYSAWFSFIDIFLLYICLSIISLFDLLFLHNLLHMRRRIIYLISRTLPSIRLPNSPRIYNLNIIRSKMYSTNNRRIRLLNPNYLVSLNSSKIIRDISLDSLGFCCLVDFYCVCLDFCV